MSRTDAGNALVFKPTRACPARCDFCCDPTERAPERLHRSVMLDLVEQVATAVPGLISIIGFTGGEPFLVFDDIFAVLERASTHGMSGAVVSSSHWAHDASTARARLAALATVGLQRYATSCDHEHLRFVPLERIRHAVSAALELGLTVTVTGTFAQPGQQVAPLLGADLAAQVQCENKLIAPYGRASGQTATVQHYGLQAELAQWGCYRRWGHDILVQPNGDVLPCCSTNNTINPLIFGNVCHGDPLTDIVTAITHSFLLRILKFESFALLRELVARHVSTADWPAPTSASGPCGYCAQLFSDTQRTARILHALAQEQPHYLRQLLAQAELPTATVETLTAYPS
ncbi:radical SAM/SPASM domain-containing protein [Thiospirillum jenense]|uniref:Radical SAM protein n=1 Tax=Thiospirillum jenense TaxID=1653858 RepID=A0A839H944_9GAMM|nr:radical SAM/SPASM domain-containing protein [Thiospirillum jenense]MBB1125581.1 radical SAM protein [Thiospirillum jenense]